MTENEGVRVRPAENCRLCGRQGNILYSDLRDRLFGAPGAWSLSQCNDCSLLWLNPTPVPEDLPKLYRTYYTHETASETAGRNGFKQKLMSAIRAARFGYVQLSPSRGWRLLGWFAGRIPLARDLAGADVMFLASKRGRILDVGCGNGEFLATMRDLGWDVQGLEPDPQSARIAREERNLPVHTTSLSEARLTASTFDAITMRHVIEHLPDPEAVLEECCRILKPGGQLVLVTPNIESLGHKNFGRSYRALEPPRHLILFSPRSLARMTERAGMEVRVARTSSRNSPYVWLMSVGIRDGQPSCDLFRAHVYGDVSKFRRSSLWQCQAFRVLEECLRTVWSKAGEEIVLVARRPLSRGA